MSKNTCPNCGNQMHSRNFAESFKSLPIKLKASGCAKCGFAEINLGFENNKVPPSFPDLFEEFIKNNIDITHFLKTSRPNETFLVYSGRLNTIYRVPRKRTEVLNAEKLSLEPNKIPLIFTCKSCKQKPFRSASKNPRCPNCGSTDLLLLITTIKRNNGGVEC